MIADIELIKSDYSLGLLHLAWVENNSESNLVFAQCELYPSKFKRVNYCPVQNFNDKLHYVRLECQCSVLLDFYQSFGSAGAICDNWLPVQGKLCASGLSALSPWPNLGLARQDFGARENGWPYISQSWGDVRAHHFLNWNDDEQPLEVDLEGTAWLAERLGWSFKEFPELWGSLHLTLPNPLWRELHVKMRHGSSSGVDFTFTPRSQATYADLRLRIIEEKLGAYEGYPEIALTLKDGETICASQPMVDEPERIQTAIFDSVRGLLHFEHFTGFIKNINYDIAIKTRKKLRFILPNGEREVDRIDTAVISDSLNSESGFTNSLFATSRARRRAKGAAKEMGEQWLDDPGDAREKVKKLLESSKNITIVDPYFSPEEFFDFIVAVCRDDAEVTILTTAEGLTKKEKERLQKARELAAILKRLEAHKSWKFHVEILARAPGQPPAIHDRFLLLDNEAVWHLGSSLNYLGNRASVITKLHNGELARKKIDSIRQDETYTITLDAYIARESNAKK